MGTAAVLGLLGLATALSSLPFSHPKLAEHVMPLTSPPAPTRDNPGKPRSEARPKERASPPPVATAPRARRAAADATDDVVPPMTEASRRFVWAPVSGAHAYAVRLYRGAELVFAGTTTDAAVKVPARWRLHGRPMRLSAGEYRWYVWVLEPDGRRRTPAVVQASLSVH